MKQLEEHTSLLAKATKNAFVHIDGKLHDLDLKLDNVIDNLQEFMAEMNKQFKYTWQVTVSNRLVIKLLSSGSALNDRLLHHYLQYYINYQSHWTILLQDWTASEPGDLHSRFLIPMSSTTF